MYIFLLFVFTHQQIPFLKMNEYKNQLPLKGVTGYVR